MRYVTKSSKCSEHVKLILLAFKMKAAIRSLVVSVTLKKRMDRLNSRIE